MQPEVEPVVWLGVFLVFLWIPMTMLACRIWNLGDYWDQEWSVMVLGFLGSKNLDQRIIWAWWGTAILSTIGWLMGLIAVWKDMDNRADTYQRTHMQMPGLPLPSHRDDTVFQQEHIYMQLCTAQLSILLTWTIVTLLVKPNWSMGWRYLNWVLLLAVGGVYTATAVIFFTIQDPMISHGYRITTGVLLCVHAAHGLVWDFAFWGYTYCKHPKTTVYQSLAKNDLIGSWKMFEISSFA